MSKTKWTTKEKFADSSMLNMPGKHSIAAVAINLELATWKDKFSIDGELTISDCSRSIYLDFNAEDLDQLRNSIHKLTVLRDISDKAIVWLKKFDNPQQDEQ